MCRADLRGESAALYTSREERFRPLFLFRTAMPAALCPACGLRYANPPSLPLPLPLPSPFWDRVMGWRQQDGLCPTFPAPFPTLTTVLYVLRCCLLPLPHGLRSGLRLF